MASVVCTLAPTVGLLVLWRFLQSASGGGGIVLARAIAADIASGVAAARLFSMFMTLSSVAPILAPVLGGLMLAVTGSIEINGVHYGGRDIDALLMAEDEWVRDIPRVTGRRQGWP